MLAADSADQGMQLKQHGCSTYTWLQYDLISWQ